MANIITDYPHFITSSILNWIPVLNFDKYKYVIIDSLRFLVKAKRVKIQAFVIMCNHIHLIWQILPGNKPSGVQRDFLKFTAQRIKEDLAIHNPLLLEQFRTNSADRDYQFWQRNSLKIELRTHKVFLQKLNYIHNNPVKAGLCKFPEEYLFSSASFYLTGNKNWDFLSYYFD